MKTQDEQTSLPNVETPHDCEVVATGQAPRDWRELGRRIRNEALRRTMRDARRRNGCAPRYPGRLHNPGGLS